MRATWVRCSGLAWNTLAIRTSWRCLGFLVPPFVNRLFPDALAAIKHLKQSRRVVILFDGDAASHPRENVRSGLLDLVDENVLMHRHKE